jgi:hypothetical protein
VDRSAFTHPSSDLLRCGCSNTSGVKRTTSTIALTAFVVVALVFVAGISRLELKRYRCKQRNAAFDQRVKIVEQDARKQLKIGTKKDDVARFYEEHKIPLQVVSFKGIGFVAIGTLFTVGGCAPLGCGTENALIGVRVKVDADGTVTDEPEVVNMYTDCV